MFERFTDRARRVTVLAQEEARLMCHNCIGTEHILLGLSREGEGVAARALDELGVSLEACRIEIQSRVPKGDRPPGGHLPFTPRAKKVLELALREALQLGHNYIGTEHVLLGLIREGEGVGAQVLVSLGADLGRVRHKIIQLLSGYSGVKKSDERTEVEEVDFHESRGGVLVSHTHLPIPEGQPLPEFRVLSSDTEGDWHPVKQVKVRDQWYISFEVFFDFVPKKTESYTFEIRPGTVTS